MRVLFDYDYFENKKLNRNAKYIRRTAINYPNISNWDNHGQSI